MDDDGVGGIVLFLFAAGPAAGLGIWGWIQARYRNKGARYMPEKVVNHKLTRLDTDDAFVRSIVSKSSRTEGANDHNPTARAAKWKAIKH